MRQPLRLPDEPEVSDATDDVRARIIAATTRLIAEGGRDAATTRAVAAAAGVQAPTLYRQFGDMRGLLDAAAHDALAAYVRAKAARMPSKDPVADLRHGWDLHVAFGLAHPALYALMYGDPEGGLSGAVREGEAHLHALVARVAAAGRLRVSVAHAARLIAAGGNGVTLALIATPVEARDARLSASMRDAVLAAVTTPPPADASSKKAPESIVRDGSARLATRAVALRAVLADAPDAPDAGTGALSPAERHLLSEWLDRLSEAGA